MFTEWYKAEGSRLNCDADDLKAAYTAGFNSGMAVSRNHTANDRVMPDRVHFSNGTVVKIVSNKTPGVHDGVFLSVEKFADDPRSIMPEPKC
jgi:hypothetical protein